VVDEHAADMHRWWSKYSGRTQVRAVLEDVRLWGTDLNLLKGFSDQVWNYLKRWLELETLLFSDVKKLSK
jgi:hypothetical protein